MATVLMPRALQVRITRCEISPRLAINTLSNGFVERHLRAIDDTVREGREGREEESNRNMVVLFCCCFLVEFLSLIVSAPSVGSSASIVPPGEHFR
jgi:hypothetical protein